LDLEADIFIPKNYEGQRTQDFYSVGAETIHKLKIFTGFS